MAETTPKKKLRQTPQKSVPKPPLTAPRRSPRLLSSPLQTNSPPTTTNHSPHTTQTKKKRKRRIEIDECRLCFKSSSAVMIKCNDCSGGFHLNCLKPPLTTLPDGDWICGNCQAKQLRTELEKAKAALLLATLPKSSLPCRNKEMDGITAFIKEAICDEGGFLYIYGPTGTGKTTSVLAVMRILRAEVDSGVTKPFSFVEINGLKLTVPENIYRVIYQGLTGLRVGWRKALSLLSEKFSNATKSSQDDDRPYIILIDELELLVTSNQEVLYNIVNWTTTPNSKLIVIGTSNTAKLPDKISSRMDIPSLRFAPYNSSELQEIIECRLKGVDAFEKQAIEFASMKVASISGDARRALEICRRAAELADYRVKRSTLPPETGKTIVGISEVKAAIQEMLKSPHIQVMRTCSKLSKVFLAAMVHELKTGMTETTFEKVALSVSRMCVSNGMISPKWDILLRIGCKLGELGIIVCEPGAMHRLQKLKFGFSVSSDDVSSALKDSSELPWLTKYL